MPGLRLSPEESAEYLGTSERLDGYAEGVRVAVEYVKAQKLREIIAARKQPATPQSPLKSGEHVG